MLPAWERPRLGRREGFYDDLEIVAYLNHAALAPPSRFVRAAMARAVEDHGRRALGAIAAWRRQRDALRTELARLVGATSGQIALAPNTSTAVVRLVQCIPWQEGDVVVISEGEFPANVTPWQRAADTFGLRLMWLPAPQPEAFETWWTALCEALEQGARVLALSAVQFQTGLRMPLERIGRACKAAGTELFVDAIQACGAVPLDVADVDYLVAGGHKWLTGPEGSGFLYVAPERTSPLVPRVAGWMSHVDPLAFLLKGSGYLRADQPLRDDVLSLEFGTPNTAAAAGLGAAVQTLAQLGVQAIHRHVQAYLDRLEPELVSRGFVSRRASQPELRSGALSLLPPHNVELGAFARALDRRAVSCGTPDGHLRFAPHWANDAERELTVVLAAVDDALKKVR